MAISRPLIRVAAAALVALTAGVASLHAQEQPAPAPAPAAPAVDSNQLYVGDWDFTAQMRDSSLSGVFRINYANGQFTGIVAKPGGPPSPIRSMTVRNHFRDMTISVDFSGETFTFQAHLDNARNMTGTMSMHGGIGRLRVQKRA